MSGDFGETKDVVGRKNYRCLACYEGIPQGESHKHFKGMWSGDFQDWRMHSECYTAMDYDDFEDGFEPGSFTRPTSVA
jgi:hypothetical protein